MAATAEFPNQSVHYTHPYDSYGNWIEQKVNHSDSRPYTWSRENTYYCREKCGSTASAVFSAASIVNVTPVS